MKAIYRTRPELLYVFFQGIGQGIYGILGKERELRHGKSLIFETALGKANPLQIAICKGLISWCARRDSNARPLAPEANALSD